MSRASEGRLSALSHLVLTELKKGDEVATVRLGEARRFGFDVLFGTDVGAEGGNDALLERRPLAGDAQ